MKLFYSKGKRRFQMEGGSSMVEVLVSLVLAVLSTGGIVSGYILSANRAEWSAYSLAAQSLAMQRIEQARAAKWDPSAFPSADDLQSTNFPLVVEILDIPISGTNTVYATNLTTITTVSANPPLKMVRVDCIWRFTNRGLFTNTVATYRAPDQ